MTGGEPRIVAAGGVEGVAIRRDYGGYRGDMASSAAFVKAARWLVKLRVSGPAARQAEVAAAMDALLAGIRFGALSRPRAAAPIRVRDCPPGSGGETATLLPDPPGGEIAAHGFLATFDGGGIMATEDGGPSPLPSRVPDELCLSGRVPIGNGQAPILRSDPGPPLSVDGRTRLIVLMSDSGDYLEVVHAENLGRHLLLSHRIGETILLGGFDNVPSDDQIADILAGRSPEAARLRVPVGFTADGRTNIHLPGLPPAQPAPQPQN